MQASKKKEQQWQQQSDHISISCVMLSVVIVNEEGFTSINYCHCALIKIHPCYYVVWFIRDNNNNNNN